MIYLGIDPGVSGGIAALTTQGMVLEVVKMPDTPMELVVALRDLSDYQGIEGPVFATLENVSASPQMGVTSAFTFGRGFGRIEATLAALGIPFDLVIPRKWQGAMQCLTHGDKNISKARALQLFPRQKITHAIADALLIAEYGRRLREFHGEKVEGQKGKAQAERERQPAARRSGRG